MKCIFKKPNRFSHSSPNAMGEARWGLNAQCFKPSPNLSHLWEGKFLFKRLTYYRDSNIVHAINYLKLILN